MNDYAEEIYEWEQVCTSTKILHVIINAKEKIQIKIRLWKTNAKI